MGSFLRLLRLLQLYFYVVSLCFYGCTSLFGRLFSDFVSTLHDRIYDDHSLKHANGSEPFFVRELGGQFSYGQFLP